MQQQGKQEIHKLFCAAIGEKPPTLQREIRFRGWVFNQNTNWGEAVSKIAEAGVPGKQARAKLEGVGSVLLKAEKALTELEREFPGIYANIEAYSTHPIYRSNDRLAIKSPRTAKSPLEEINLIRQGVALEEHTIKNAIAGKHMIYGELVEFWRCVTGEKTIKKSQNSRLVKMLVIATNGSPEAVSKYLHRNQFKKEGRQKAGQT